MASKDSYKNFVDTTVNLYDNRQISRLRNEEVIQIVQDIAKKANIYAGRNFEEFADNLSQRFINTNYTGRYTKKILENKENSRLADLSDNDIERKFKSILRESLNYSILKSCGINKKADFTGIESFDTKALTQTLAAAFSDLNNRILSEIGRSIQYERDNGSRIMGNSEGEVSERGSTEHIRSDADERNTDAASSGYRPTSGTNGGRDDSGNVEAGGNNGAAENARPNGVGRQNEQSEKSGTGSDLQRTDLQINNSEAKAEDKQSPAFSNAQNNNIIGNTPYRFIGKKTYRKLESQTALRLAEEIEKAKIKYSGRKNDDGTITLTVSRDDIERVDKLTESLKEHTKKENSFSAEEVDIARRTNLVDFLQSRGQQLKRVGTDEYTMPEHDSMRISSQKGFFWNSQNIGGNALDFCMKYYGMDFQTSVSELLSFNGYDKGVSHTSQIPKSQENEEKPHKPLPYDLDDKTNRVYAYLTRTRGIDADIVKELIDEGKIAQDIKGNAVFKIFDKDGSLSGAEITTTLSDRRYKQSTERDGSGFTFDIKNNSENPPRLHFFEAAIDALSFYDVNKDVLKFLKTDVKAVSMGGLKDIVVENEIKKYEEAYGRKPEIYICSDNDEAGDKFAEKIIDKFSDYNIQRTDMFNSFINFNQYAGENLKDWNDLLLRRNSDKTYLNRKERNESLTNRLKDMVLADKKVENAFKNSDTENFRIEVEAAVKKYVFDIAMQNLNENADFYNSFTDQKQRDFTEEIIESKLKEDEKLQEQRETENEKPLTEQLADLSSEIKEKQKLTIELINNQDFTGASKVCGELEELRKKADEMKDIIQGQEITGEDVQALRSVEPKRKSVQNMLDEEAAKTTKFEKLLNNEMGEKSAYEMRNSDNEWRNDETKTVPIIEIQERDLPEKFADIRKNNDIPRGTFVNKDTGIEVIFGKKSIDEVVAKAIQDDKRNAPVEARMAALYQMKDLIENAVCFDSQISEYNSQTSKNKSPNTLFIHRMYGILNSNDEKYLANLSVEEFYSTDSDNKFKDTNNRLYAFRDIKITPIEANRIFSPAVNNKNVAEDTSLDVSISIPQLYEIVKTYDQTFFENPEAAGRTEREKEIQAHKDFEKAVEVLENKSTEKEDLQSVENDNIDKVIEAVSLQDKIPNYRVGDHVEIDYGDTHYSGTIHSKSDTSINIKPDNSYSWDYRDMSREYFENALRKDSRNSRLFEEREFSETEHALKNKHTIYFADNSDDDNELVSDARKAVLKNLHLHYSDNRYMLRADAQKSGNITKDVILKDFGNDIKSIESYISEHNLVPNRFLYNYKADRAGNFSITEENTDIPQKEKFRNNIEAIKTLKTIESENRTASHDEQEILSKYVGWGGISEAFDENKTNWSKEYAELKELLSDSEYAAARSSTTNAFYTSSEVIKSMYAVLENLGFQGGKLLEPSMGIGRFFGNLPDNLKDKTQLYGVELDSLTGRIAKQLYPKADIQINGFEKTAFQSNFFDVAAGNVPFGNFSVYDTDFKKGDLIHDYFFKKSLDKVKNGGIIAFVTSKGTLDKQDNSVRKYLAERADLLGAIRLPKGAFSETDVTSDIIFLQKRDTIRDFTKDEMPDWVNLAKDENGIEMNRYFVNNPNMICGRMAEVSGRFGMETICKPIDTDLSDLLAKAVSNISGQINTENTYESISDTAENEKNNINPNNYRNFCFAQIDDEIYFRNNNEMEKVSLDGKKAERLKGMINVSEALRNVIFTQKENYEDSYVKAAQNELNSAYDSFTAKFGLINDKRNMSLFREDDTSALISSLENLNDKGEFISKADIFTKRTIIPYIPITHTDTASEALAVSISEKARVDLDFMSELCGKDKEEIITDLKGVIFENPITKQYENADEYLSGNVREKLKTAEKYAETDSKYAENVNSLKAVQPDDLKPEEISVQLGSTWIPTKYYEQFMYELLDTPKRCRSDYTYRLTEKNPFNSGSRGDKQAIIIDYDEHTASYGISNKSSYSADKTNIKANKTYGTDRMNAYKIIEETLNLKPVKVMDYVEDLDGKKHAVLNEKETLLAQEKADEIKNKFKEWIFDDYDRTQDLCRIYNDKFNSIRPREYDGSHITFGGINPEIKLRKHQIDAIAHTLYGGNTLLAHSVGAGKTFEMVASAMESKRLGLCTKSMLVVPKHIVNQVAKEFLQLYPTANILVPNEKDFSKENRQRFCSRIATGNYDAIILSHTQLEKIPLSKEKQIEFIQNEIEECIEGLERLENEQGGRGFSVKQLETTKKNLEVRLQSLNNDEKRDTTITFEEMGIDKLYVDEAHLFKNLYFNTKMGRNVAGINASSVSQRATDLFMKCQYLDEITDSKGVVFATGTPISNSMSEMYTMQKFLQHDKLKQRGLNHFDAWASSFGETKLSLELAPEGKGYQMKTRFAKFFNLPELMNMFKEMADVKTADVLNLPVPKANYHTIVTEASEYQKEMVDGLAERANKIRHKEVSSEVDNMLKVTNDGRKLALDQRMADPLLPDEENSKVNECVKNVYEIYKNTEDEKSTQMIFCDLSTPHYDGSFNVYDDIKEKLAAKGVPKEEIAFIHDCKNDTEKQKLFTKVRNGDVRVLLGSTSKMGTGTNAQRKLKALHHIDCPYRPSDLEQRNGRIIRQGNENPEVDIYNYVTKGTFDAYLYQLVENKQRFISQIMTSKSPARVAEDIDDTVLSYAQIKALASGNPKIKEKMDLDIEVNRLRTVFAGYQENKRDLQSKIAQEYPNRIQKLSESITGFKKDLLQAQDSKTEEFSQMTVDEKVYTDKKEAGTALLQSIKNIRTDKMLDENKIGSYRGFDMFVSFDKFEQCYNVSLKNSMSYTSSMGSDVFGNITRLDNILDNGIAKKLDNAAAKLDETKHLLEVAKNEVTQPFSQMEQLREKENRLEQLNKELSIDSTSKDDKEENNENKEHTDKNDRMCI